MKNVTILNDLNTLNKLHTSSVESYTTNNGIVDFTCENAGYVDNVVIEGKTLVNLNTFTAKGYDGNRIWFYDTNYSLCTNNAQYTIFNTSDKLISIQYTLNGNWVDGEFIYLQPNTSQLVTVYNNHQFGGIFGGTLHGWSNSDNSYNELKQSIIILEGDHTGKSISYFEGLKSVGQGDNIEVLTYKRGSENLASNLTFTEGKYVVSIDGGIGNNVEFKHSNEYIEVEGGCEYLFDNINGQFAIYDSSKNVIPTSWVEIQDSWFKGDNYQSSFIYAMPKNAKYVRINLPISNLKPYSLIKTKSDKNQIPVTLRSLPNGVKDTIEKRGNKYVKVQRCGEVTLNGSEGWGIVTHFDNVIRFRSALENLSFKSSELQCISDLFKGDINTQWNLDYEAIDQDGTAINIRILKTKLTTQDLEGFKTWLKSNPTTVVYELATPQIIELPNFNLQTYKGENTLIVNSGVIQCDASFDVCEGIRSELDVIKYKVSNLDDYINNSNKIDFTSQCSLLNGWKVWGKNEYFNAFVVDNCVKVTCLIYQGTTDAYTGILKIPKMYAPTSSEFIPMVSDSGSCFTACLDPGGYLTNESKISNFNWISFNFTYPLSK